MTFYEAALRILEREGKPLHVDAIVEIAVRENLLSHVGKSPEEVMQSRLLAMARRRNDRKVLATAPQTYALAGWGLQEDPAALDLLAEEPKGKDEPPLRPRERHPIPSDDNARVAGRGERTRGRARREDETDGKRRRRYPPLSEVALEVLSQASAPMSVVDLAAAARERELVSEDLGAEALLNALKEDNRRRSDAGRKPVFIFQVNGDLSVERVTESETPELEAVPIPVLGAPLAEGRVERGHGASRLMAQAAEHRRQILRLLRRRLTDIDAAGFERIAISLLDQQCFRELKMAKRGKNGPLVVARRKDGLSDLRFAIQILRGGAEITRDDIADLRRDISRYGAQMGMVISAADVGRDAKHDAQIPGQAVVLLWCAEALVELCLAKRLGVTCTMVEVWDLDEEFFKRGREKKRDEDRGGRRREERPAASSERVRTVTPSARSEAAAGKPTVVGATNEIEKIGLMVDSSQSALSPSPVLEPNRPEPLISAEPIPAIDDKPSPEPILEEKQAGEARRREEEQARAEAHERIEAAEIRVRGERVP